MRMKLIVVMAVAFALAFSGLGLAADTTPKGTQQANCPVQDGKIDKKLYADYKGKRIYFCCAGCSDEFKKDPEKYLKKMEAAGITPENAPPGK